MLLFSKNYFGSDYVCPESNFVMNECISLMRPSIMQKNLIKTVKDVVVKLKGKIGVKITCMSFQTLTSSWIGGF